MAGFHHFVPLSYRDHWGGPAGKEQERSPSPRVQTPPGTDSEDEAPWLPPSSSPTPRPCRRGYTASSPRESHSLTHVACRTPAQGRKPHRSGSQYLEDAWMESQTKFSPAWQQQPRLGPGPCQAFPPSQGDSPPLYPRGANSALSVGSLRLDEAHTGDRWAVPVCKHAGLCSPASVMEKSSVRSQECRTQRACSRKRDEGDLFESFAGQSSQPSAFRPEVHSQYSHVLRSKLEEAMMSSRDQKIVALVLTRLKQAQRMRELQQQAAVAWEELKRSDQKVQLTLERERRRLLQQSREQWQPQPDPRKARLGREQPGRRRRRRDGQAKSVVQPDKGWRAALKHQENRGLDNLEPRAHAQADPLQQCQLQHLREREKVLQSLREFNRQQQQERLERACPKKQVHATEDTKKVQEGNLSSLVNFQARKVLMDCQAKAEELLRKLSLEQRFQGCQESHQGPRKDQHHRELQENVRKEAEQSQQEELERQRQVRKRILLELEEQKMRQARSHAREMARDRAQQHLRELNNLRDKSQQVLKLKAEREEKSHVEAIKEAVQKKERTTEQMSRGQEPALHEFQKVPRASKRDDGALGDSCLDPVAAEGQLHHHPPRGDY